MEIISNNGKKEFYFFNGLKKRTYIVGNSEQRRACAVMASAGSGMPAADWPARARWLEIQVESRQLV